MTFELALFGGGNELWSVTYDGRDGRDGRDFAGLVPWGARVLLARLEKSSSGGRPEG